MKTSDIFPDYKLRDDFAKLALQEILRSELEKPEFDIAYIDVADFAYGIADAMINARNE